MSRKFIRTKEDFTCENCGFSVEGTGFTNHCSKCLWSKHMDINPGDRRKKCGGMMEPVKIEMKKGTYIIIHRCLKCSLEKKNKVDSNDNFEQILKIYSQNT